MIEIETRVSTAAAVWRNASIFGMRANACSADCSFEKKPVCAKGKLEIEARLVCLPLRLNLNFLDDGSVMQTRLACRL